MRILLTAGGAIAAYVVTMTALYALTHKVVFTLAFTNGLAATYIIIWRKRQASSPLIARIYRSPTNVIMTLVMTIVICMIAVTLAMFVKILLNAPSPIQGISSQVPIEAIITLSILVVPIGEEALMRGFVYPMVRQQFSAPVTIALSACAFALLHGNTVQITLTLPLGIACGFVYEHTHNLTACIVTHMLFNTLTLLPLPLSNINAEHLPTKMIVEGVAIALFSLGIMFAIWWLFMHYDKKG
jgi:membrane protease YdiL (CAAX protease family)